MSGKGKKRKIPPVTSNGTGYGGGKNDTTLLVAGRKKAEKANHKDDEQNIKFLTEILEELKFHQDHAMSRSITSVIGKGGRFNLEEETEERKRLLSLLAKIFRNQVPTDWDQRKELYDVALGVCRLLASSNSLGPLLGDKEDQEGILYWLLDFSRQAEQIMKRHADSSLTEEEQGDIMLATQVSEVAGAALKTSLRCHRREVAELSVISLGERYQSELGPLRFDTVDSMQNHYFLNKFPTANPSLNTRLLFKELSAYRSALPVEYGSSCFCRVMNSRLDLLRIMITGPDETPYANGCFFFDIHIPTTFPQTAPMVQFLTTGGGKIRFNPNLYNCGKVCLSLLGTWDGPGWISGQSTLLQLLVSIQSLILVPDPHFNEPGYEKSRSTPCGKQASKTYNKRIRGHTLSAAIENHLLCILGNTNQYTEFELVMKTHFLEKRSLIQKELWSWAKEDKHLTERVENICGLLDQLASRERSSKKRACKIKRSIDVISLAKKENSVDKPIILDLSDAEEDRAFHYQKLSSVAQEKNKTIEIDLSGDDGERQDEGPIVIDDTTKISSTTGSKRTGDTLIDLTL